MSLPNPVPNVDPGPDYANNIQSCFNILDQHNHSPGSGAQINSSGLNINADLLYNNNNATTLRSIRFQPQLTALALASDIGCLYESGVDLYYNDGLGNQIRITQSGNVTGASGTITGLPSGTASASYAAGTFTFQAATLTPANIDGGSFIFRNNTASSNGITVSPPNALGSNYGITLPLLPASTLPLSISTSGTMSAAQITFVQLDPATQLKITGTAPTIQKFLTGSGTYTTPVSPPPLYIEVVMMGAGGGGGGNSSATNGLAGGNTTFGTFLLVANGGGGGLSGSSGGVGGTASLGTGPVGIALTGGTGGFASPNTNGPGAMGASSPLGGGGGGTVGNNGTPGSANTGSGGGGAGGAGDSGAGGGAGGYVSAVIYTPLSTYAYSVGVGGTGGDVGTVNNGGSGVIIVKEFYQ